MSNRTRTRKKPKHKWEGGVIGPHPPELVDMQPFYSHPELKKSHIIYRPKENPTCQNTGAKTDNTDSAHKNCDLGISQSLVAAITIE